MISPNNIAPLKVLLSLSEPNFVVKIIVIYYQDEFISKLKSSQKEDFHTDQALKEQLENISAGKLTNRLIEQGLLTKSMVDQLRREWEAKAAKDEAKKKRQTTTYNSTKDYGLQLSLATWSTRQLAIWNNEFYTIK